MNPPDQSTTYAYEWHITVKADEPAGAIDALFNCIRSFQSGAEPIGGTCPASMGNRMTYDVIKDGKPTPTPSLAPTPRTQKQLLPINSHTLPGDVVYADFARTLERELAETERLRFGADADRRQLRCDLSDAKAEASHYMAVAQKATDELIFLRADSLKAHQMTCAAALERDAEREKVRVLREALDEAQSCGGLTGSIFMQARAALAATEKSP
jgi:hypothetical protein